MTELTRAELISVTGTNDTPDGNDPIGVHFNPTTLKVALANTLKASRRGSSNRAAQFVDKSSSTLTVELIFDTSLENTDVRQATKAIAERFMKPSGSGRRMRAPKRCRFQWGAFEFTGLMQSFDETLDFFSSGGTPLRATVALKLNEDRFQFKTRDAARADRETPTLGLTGAAPNEPPGGPPDGGGNPVNDATRAAGQDEKAWRDAALFNGVESARHPSGSILAIPQISTGGALGATAAIKGSAGIGAPGFRFGASATLGTSIGGAFSVQAKASPGLFAESVVPGGIGLVAEAGGGVTGSASASASAGTSASAKGKITGGVGFS